MENYKLEVTVETEAAADVSAPFIKHIERSVDLTDIDHKESAPTQPGCFECPTCLRAAVLVLVEMTDGSSQLRCEMCQNKTPVSKILKWGARPRDKPGNQQPARTSLR